MTNMNKQILLEALIQEDGEYETLNEYVRDRSLARLGFIGGAAKQGLKNIGNTLIGRGDRRKSVIGAGRDSAFTQLLSSHGQRVYTIVGNMTRFLAKNGEELKKAGLGQHVAEMQNMANTITQYLAKHKDVFNFSGLPTPQEEPPQQPEQQQPDPQQPQPNQPQQPQHPEQQQGSGEPQPEPQQPQQPSTFQRTPQEPQRQSTFQRQRSNWLDTGSQNGRQSTFQRPKSNWLSRGPQNESVDDDSVDIAALYNLIQIDEGMNEPQKEQVASGLQAGMAKLIDIYENGSDEEKQMVVKALQDMERGVDYKTAVQPLVNLGRQMESAMLNVYGRDFLVENRLVDGLNDFYDNFRAKSDAKRVKKEDGEKVGGASAISRLDHYKYELSQALGALDADMKKRTDRDKGGPVDAAIKDFQTTIAQFTRDGKLEGTRTRWDKIKDWAGSAATTAATYLALGTVAPAIAVGGRLAHGAVRGAATSVLRDLARGNVDKKGMLRRALIGAGLGGAASYASGAIGDYIQDQYGDQIQNIKDTVGGWFGKGAGAGGSATGAGVDGSVDTGSVDTGSVGQSPNVAGSEATGGGYQHEPMPGFEENITLPNGQQAVSVGEDGVFAVRGQNGEINLVDRTGNPVDEMNFDADDVQYMKDIADVELDSGLPQESAFGGTHFRANAGNGASVNGESGTYEGGIRTADANGNPVDLSPEDAAKVNAVRGLRQRMAGGQNEMPDNVKDALGYTDEGDLDVEQVPRVVKHNTGDIQRKPGESVQKWLARKKVAELNGMRDQALRDGYGKTIATPNGTETRLNGKFIGGKFIPD